jgi:hypothetical protein
VSIERTWYTTEEAAAQLGIAPATVRWAKRAGLLAVTEIAPRIRAISEDEVERYRREHLGKAGWTTRRRDAASIADAARHGSRS